MRIYHGCRYQTTGFIADIFKHAPKPVHSRTVLLLGYIRYVGFPEIVLTVLMTVTCCGQPTCFQAVAYRTVLRPPTPSTGCPYRCQTVVQFDSAAVPDCKSEEIRTMIWIDMLLNQIIIWVNSFKSHLANCCRWKWLTLRCFFNKVAQTEQNSGSSLEIVVPEQRQSRFHCTLYSKSTTSKGLFKSLHLHHIYWKTYIVSQLHVYFFIFR